jgi:hypothetical protein
VSEMGGTNGPLSRVGSCAECVADWVEIWWYLVFDNHRVLHGRSAFKGARRLCGAYVNGDDYRSRIRTLERRYGDGGMRDAR